MDGLGGPFAKGEKSDTKRQTLSDITYWWTLKLQQTSEYNKKSSRLTDIKNKLMVISWGERQYRGGEVGGTNYWASRLCYTTQENSQDFIIMVNGKVTFKS